MDEVTQAKFQEALKDEAFVKELAELDAPEDVQAKLKERGVEISVKDVLEIRDALSKSAETDGELDEDALEDVAGGLLASMIIGGVGASVLFGAGLGVGIGDAIRRRW